MICPLSLVLFLATGSTFAQSYPLLEELNRQTQSLYRDVESGLVRVQLPTPKWVREAAANDDPLRKWDRVVDPQVKQKLEKHLAQSARTGAGKIAVSITPATQPSPDSAPADTANSLNASWKMTPGANSGEIVLDSKGDGGAGMSIVIHTGGDAEGGHIAGAAPLRMLPQPVGTFAPNNIGLLLDDSGHILVPIYIERDTIAQTPVRVMVGEVETVASFVGADEKMQVTILKLLKPAGRPLRMANGKPNDGAMVMLLNPNSGTGRLMLWTGGERDYGVVVGMDGTVNGFVRYGQFLGGANSRPVIDQLIKVGSIQRAIIGARLTEVAADDPRRADVPALGDRPALTVDEVKSASLAEGAGLKRGDFILQMGDQPVGDLTTWAAMSARGGETRLLVLRDGATREVKINLHPEAGQ